MFQRSCRPSVFVALRTAQQLCLAWRLCHHPAPYQLQLTVVMVSIRFSTKSLRVLRITGFTCITGGYENCIALRRSFMAAARTLEHSVPVLHGRALGRYITTGIRTGSARYHQMRNISICQYCSWVFRCVSIRDPALRINQPSLLSVTDVRVAAVLEMAGC